MDEKRSSLAIPVAIIVCILIMIGAFYYQSQNPSQNLAVEKDSIIAGLGQLIPEAQGVM
jgi:hypothetical protein